MSSQKIARAPIAAKAIDERSKFLLKETIVAKQAGGQEKTGERTSGDQEWTGADKIRAN